MKDTKMIDGDSPTIFISHCSADEKYAGIVNKKLQDRGVKTYYAPESIRVGNDWQDNIKHGIQNCHAVLMLISSHSQKSPWVKREFEWFSMIKAAAEKEKQSRRELFPVVLHGVKPHELDIEIQRLNFVDCSSVIGDDKQFEEKIDELIAQIRKIFSLKEENCIEIPVITYAMTREQAQELVSEEIFISRHVSPEEKDRYDELKKVLSDHGLTNMDSILDCYSSTADDWQPLLTANGSSISRMIKEIEDRVNLEPVSKDQHIVRTVRVSQQALENPFQAPNLQHDRCILIIDAISLFHPLLRAKLEALGFTQSRNTNLMMIVIPPISHSKIPIYSFLEKAYIELGSMKSAFKFFSEKLEIGYELGIGDRYSLPRWLINNLTKIATQGLMPNEAKSTKMNQSVTAEEDYGRYIFGAGVS